MNKVNKAGFWECFITPTEKKKKKNVGHSGTRL